MTAPRKRSLPRPAGRATIAGMSQGEKAVQAQPSELRKPVETPLEVVVGEIAADAARDPVRYARDAIVPEGGE